ncbi:MAG TPA: serine hydrolase domain-containing protein [Terriglobales bacterium]|nr:serine hydrolase domain-containing protein [Terriglobales bacterium]
MDRSSQDIVSPRPAFAKQEQQFARAFALLRDAILQRTFPGAALAVTYQGDLIASQGFGQFTYEGNSPEVHADTIFDLASLTKVVATTPIAMLLHERGKLDLDEPLARTMPEFVSMAPKHQQSQRAAVTIRMLLAHSSGLPAYERLYEFANTHRDLVHGAMTARLTAAPGTRAEYSDVGFILLGEVLASKAGLPLDLFARQEIFTPLGMSRTRFKPPAEWKSEMPPTENDEKFRGRVIQGEVNDENAYVMAGVAGHAGVFASATDLSRFAECMLRGGSPILRHETVKLFTQRESSPLGTTRALGWDTRSRPESSSGRFFSPTAFGHLGFTGTSLWIDPDRKLSVTLLTNRTWPDRASQDIRQLRPAVHDAIVEALEGK